MTVAWDKMYKLSLNYIIYYGFNNIKETFKTKDGVNYDEEGYDVPKWISFQIMRYTEGSMEAKKANKFEKLGLLDNFTSDDERWNEMFGIAKKYYEKYQYCNIPINDNEENKEILEDWIKEQQDLYNKGMLTQFKIDVLIMIGVIFNSKNSAKDKKWEDAYELLVKYKENYNNLDIPVDFKTKDGINYDPKGLNLYRWISSQRTAYKQKKLSPYRITKLIRIGLIWDRDKERWDYAYGLAKKYYKHYGNLNVDYHFRTNDGINYDENGFRLGLWIDKVRSCFSTGIPRELTKEEIDMLNKIEMIWHIKEYEWEKNYKLAKKYYEHYKDLNVPENFKTKDGVNYDENGVDFDNWIKIQRHAYNGSIQFELSDEQIGKLNEIEMIWNKLDYNWDENFKLIIEYYKHYGNLRIPEDFRTKDGVNYDEEGIHLYSWLRKQFENKKNGKLKKDNLSKLMKIEVLYNSSKRAFAIEKITKKNLLEKKKQLIELTYAKLNECDNEKELSKDDINNINKSFAKVLYSKR